MTMNLIEKLEKFSNFHKDVADLLTRLTVEYRSLKWDKSYISSAECVVLVGKMDSDISDWDSYKNNMVLTQELFNKMREDLDNEHWISLSYDDGFRISVECRCRVKH